jgi:hypothetical protein
VSPERVAADLVTALITPAERAAVFRLQTGGPHLHFLQVFEHGFLPLRAVDDADDRHAVDGEVVLAREAPFTWKPPSSSPVLTDGSAVARLWKLRPLGMTSNCSAGMFRWRVDAPRSMSGVSATTWTVSVRPPTVMLLLTVAAAPSATVTSGASLATNPDSSNLTVYRPGSSAGAM